MDGDEGGRTLATWLESLDLEQYIQNFRDVGIFNLKDCVTLDSDFLNDIGINLLGHRKRILEHLPLIDINKYHEEHDRAKSVRTLPPNQDSIFTYPSPSKGEVTSNIVLPKRSRSEKKANNKSHLLVDMQKDHPPISPTTPTDPPQRCSPQNVALPIRVKSPPPNTAMATEKQAPKTTPPVPAKRGEIPALLQETEKPKAKPVPKPRKTLQKKQILSTSTSVLPSQSDYSTPRQIRNSVSISGLTIDESSDFSGDTFDPIKSASLEPTSYQAGEGVDLSLPTNQPGRGNDSSLPSSPLDLDLSFVPRTSCESDRRTMSEVYVNMDIFGDNTNANNHPISHGKDSNSDKIIPHGNNMDNEYANVDLSHNEASIYEPIWFGKSAPKSTKSATSTSTIASDTSPVSSSGNDSKASPQIDSIVPVPGTDMFGHSTGLSTIGLPSTATSSMFDSSEVTDEGVYANVEPATPPKMDITPPNTSSALSELDLDFFTKNTPTTCTSSTPNVIGTSGPGMMTNTQLNLNSSISGNSTGSPDASFELPPPDFPPPPLPPPPPPTDSLSMFDPLACESKPTFHPEPAMPPVPPRGATTSLNSGYVNVVAGQTAPSNNPGQPVQSPWPSVQGDLPAELCFTPNKGQIFSTQLQMNDSSEYCFATYNKTPQKTKLHENMKLPSLSTPGPDPFKDDDPFTEFGVECAVFNQGGDDLSNTDNDGTVATRADNSMGVYEFAQEDNSGDFDPFGLKESNQGATGGPKEWSSSASPCTLNDIPPPPRWDKALDDPGRLYSMAFGYNNDQSTDESMSDLDEPEPVDSGNSPVILPNPVLRPISIVSDDEILHQKKGERAGYLYKQGGQKGNKGWRKRWVIFNGKSVRYYANAKSQVSKRIVPVTCMTGVTNQIKANDTHKFKFNVETKNRTFQFAAETLDDCTHWCSCLMAAILTKPPSEAVLEGGEMNYPDRQGSIRFERYRRNLHVVLKGGRMCYYNTLEDYKIASPIHEIEMKLASVKELPRNKLRLATHYTQFVLAFETYEDCVTWRMAMEESIADALGDNTILEQIKKNPSNHECADCSAPDPHWASINMGIVLCKQCAGIHRKFDLNVSKVRSLRMDTSVWSPSLIEMMKQIGNHNANLFWEKHLRAKSGFNQDMESAQRKQHLENKYENRKYIDKHPLSDNKPALNEELLKAASTADILLTMMLVFSGADVKVIKPGTQEETAFSIAKAAGQRLQMELLYQNGGDLTAARLCEEPDKARESKIRSDVRTQGFLLKTGSDKKDFLKRFCVLEHGCMRYFTNEKSGTAKGVIDHENMLCVQATPTDRSILSIKAPLINQKMEITNRYPEAFELSTCASTGSRVYLFAAASPEEKMTWMRKISQLICPLPLMEDVRQQDFCLAGKFYVKEGLSSTWYESWVMVNKKVVLYTDKDMKLTEDVDLRKAVNIKYQGDALSNCTSCKESGKHFVLDLPGGRALYFQADLLHDTERLFNAISNLMKSGGDTLIDQQLTSDDVPVIVDKCLKFIDDHGLQEEGIYRLAATNSKVDTLLATFAKDAHAVKLELGTHTVHEVANALKRFFRNLKDPLLTSHLYNTWIEKSLEKDVAGKTTMTQTKLDWYHYYIRELPTVHSRTLRRLVIHLAKLSGYSVENKMTVKNIAASFGSTLMKAGVDSSTATATVLGGAEGGQNIPHEMRVIDDIITNHEQLFELEKEKENQIAAGEKRLRDLQARASKRVECNVFSKQSTIGDPMMVSVHFLIHNGHSESVHLKHDTTVQEIIGPLLTKFKVQASPNNYALHEMVCNGAVERLLYPKDNVYTVVMSWADWQSDYSRTACLCLKPSELADKLESNFKPEKGPFLELKFSKKDRSFTKFAFQFRSSKLTYSKKISQKPVNSWNVEDLSIYIGADTERKAAKFPLTFMKKGDKVGSKEMPNFGHTLSFGSESDQLEWAAAMVKAQNPGPLTT
ncbi:arf-GAP with Rho-GAP domain, ANK repeat and PH domain-containing protein 2-like isoform X1 [Mizuhopecten yessoensis]|uniref:arf-GAP with Rho-GAP domain, ANK repeat and PH domain-containing protein 2-like isoform X1 n=1 Tax=Mizuhopecten yessoensis TaxID=6573 RepID=UPI000B45B00B|nr:arf-GAP with Rho-GAP domain, ANK repeat and PH domain-containing protein 2-like isoform X1 [Mizuhopecten yessoensis]